MKTIIKKFTNKWGTKFLKLVTDSNNEFKLILTKREYNPQTEITDYRDYVLFNIYNREYALEVFKKFKKLHKLKLKLDCIKNGI